MQKAHSPCNRLVRVGIAFAFIIWGHSYITHALRGGMGFGRNAYSCVWGREGVKAAMCAYANNKIYRNVYSCVLTNWLLSAIKLSDIRLQLRSSDASLETAHPKVAGSTPNASLKEYFLHWRPIPVPSHRVARACRDHRFLATTHFCTGYKCYHGIIIQHGGGGTLE